METDTIFFGSFNVRAVLWKQPMHGLALIGQLIAERAALLEKLREITTLSVEQRLITALHKTATQRKSLDTSGRIEVTSARYRLLFERVGATRDVLGRLVSEDWRDAPVALCMSNHHRRCSDGWRPSTTNRAPMG